MLIEEIIRSCRSAQVAEAAVASMGPSFALDVAAAAETVGMGVGEFTAVSVQRFARHGGEGEMRAVMAAMSTSQEPILDGLHRILSIMIETEDQTRDQRLRERRADEATRAVHRPAARALLRLIARGATGAYRSSAV